MPLYIHFHLHLSMNEGTDGALHYFTTAALMICVYIYMYMCANKVKPEDHTIALTLTGNNCCLHTHAAG